MELVGKEDGWYLETNLYEYLDGFACGMVDSDLLGRAFEPDQRFESPDGTPIRFDADYFGGHRGISNIPGPFACAEAAGKRLA